MEKENEREKKKRWRMRWKKDQREYKTHRKEG